MDKQGRKHDIKAVEDGLRSPDPLMRKVAKIAGDKIKKQLSDSWLRSAREKMIHETRMGRRDNATQIRDDIVKHRGGKDGKGGKGEILTVGIHWEPGQYESVFGYE